MLASRQFAGQLAGEFALGAAGFAGAFAAAALALLIIEGARSYVADPGRARRDARRTAGVVVRLVLDDREAAGPCLSH